MKNLEEILRAVASTSTFDFAHMVDVNQKTILGHTPLHVVCGWGDSEAAETLIKAGADVNAEGEFGMTPLFSAIEARSASTVKVLLDNGANPLQEAKGIFKGNTPLIEAEMAGDKEINKLLKTAIGSKGSE